MREPKAPFYILELLCVFVLLYIWVEHSHKTFNFFTSLSLSLSLAPLFSAWREVEEKSVHAPVHSIIYYARSLAGPLCWQFTRHTRLFERLRWQSSGFEAAPCSEPAIQLNKWLIEDLFFCVRAWDHNLLKGHWNENIKWELRVAHREMNN